MSEAKTTLQACSRCGDKKTWSWLIGDCPLCPSCMAKEISELRRSVVEKLPKTRDGVRVVPHVDEVYYCFYIYPHKNIRSTRSWRLFGEVWHVDISSTENTLWMPVWNCYSTQATAQAAKEGSGP